MPRHIDAEKLKRDLIDNRSFYPAIVKKAIENAPIEDVVPRSEVEKAKTEVAREIFEEIEQTIMSPFWESQNYKEWYFAELKKKYIGE